MGKWMRFAVKRKKRTGAVILAGLWGMGMLFSLTQKVMAKTYTITDGQRIVTYTTFATDPAEVLGEAGMDLHAWDSYSAGGSDIQVCRALQVRLYHHGQLQLVRSQGETVAALLQRLGISLGEGDRLSHDPELYIWDGMELRIDHCFREIQTYTTTLPHPVEYCMDPALPEGSREVLRQGADGELLCTAEVHYTNFQETGREIISQEMTLAPVTELVALGTGAAPPSPEPAGELWIGDGQIRLPSGELLTYHDTAQVRATAYTHTDAGCDFITYTGTRVHIGTVAVDPRVIPYGTRMFIVSNDGCYIYGISVAEDCGGAIKGDRIDLYFPTYEECMQFGRRNCTIYFLG